MTGVLELMGHDTTHMPPYEQTLTQTYEPLPPRSPPRPPSLVPGSRFGPFVIELDPCLVNYS